MKVVYFLLILSITVCSGITECAERLFAQERASESWTARSGRDRASATIPTTSAPEALQDRSLTATEPVSSSAPSPATTTPVNNYAAYRGKPMGLPESIKNSEPAAPVQITIQPREDTKNLNKTISGILDTVSTGLDTVSAKVRSLTQSFAEGINEDSAYEPTIFSRQSRTITWPLDTKNLSTDELLDLGKRLTEQAKTEAITVLKGDVPPRPEGLSQQGLTLKLMTITRKIDEASDELSQIPQYKNDPIIFGHILGNAQYLINETEKLANKALEDAKIYSGVDPKKPDSPSDISNNPGLKSVQASIAALDVLKSAFNKFKQINK